MTIVIVRPRVVCVCVRRSSIEIVDALNNTMLLKLITLQNQHRHEILPDKKNAPQNSQ